MYVFSLLLAGSRVGAQKERGLVDDGNCSSSIDFNLDWGAVDVEADGEWKRMFTVNRIETIFVPTKVILLFWLLLDIVCPLRRLLI